MKIFPSLFVPLLFFLFVAPTSAQEVKFNDLDKSPMDVAHYPRRSAYKNYLDEDDADRQQRIKVLYSRPQVNDRDIFGGIIPWGTDWRLGANEATEVTFFQNVEINNTYLPAGTYTLFAQVYPDQWIVKVSEERFIGGSQNRDTSKDLVAVSVPTTHVGQPREYFTIGFKKIDDSNVHMVFAWDQTRAELPIRLAPTSFAPEDASPMDLVQYPNRSRLRNFLEADELAANEPQVRVVYSRPQKKGRKIFGELVEYGENWRLGANETTEITFFNDVTIGGQNVKAGRYGLFAVPREGEWEFILHKNVQSWGTPNHKPEDNVLTLKAPTEKTPRNLEALSMTFVERSSGQVELVVGWDDRMARLPITLSGRKS